MKLIDSFQKKIADSKERKFLKKHGVRNRREYDLKYDEDYNPCGGTIRRMFHGYPYIAEISEASALEVYSCKTWLDGYSYLKQWLATECRGKARATIERTIKGSDWFLSSSTTGVDWFLNDIGGQDNVYVGFQDERDYLMFLLKWKTS